MCTDVVFICRGVLCSTQVHEQAEWIGTLFQSVWLIVVVLFLFVNFRVRGVRSWAPRPLVAMGGGGGGGDIENNDGSNELSPRLPKNQKHAFNKAFFIVSGRSGGGTGGGEEGGAEDGEGGHGSGLWTSLVAEGGAVEDFRMTTSLRKNPKYLTLATEPWCLSPGTFVVPEEKEGKEACSTDVGEEKEVVAGMGEDVGGKQIDLVL